MKQVVVIFLSSGICYDAKSCGDSAARTLDEYSMVHPLPCTLNPAPCTLHPQPSTLNPQPCTMNPVNPKYENLCTSNLKPQTWRSRNPKT